MRTIGNIERFLVLGIVVVIGAILTVAITGARDLEKNAAPVQEAVKPAAGKGGTPLKSDSAAAKSGGAKPSRDAMKDKPKAPRDDSAAPGPRPGTDPGVEALLTRHRQAIQGRSEEPAPAAPVLDDAASRTGSGGTMPGSAPALESPAVFDPPMVVEEAGRTTAAGLDPSRSSTETSRPRIDPAEVVPPPQPRSPASPNVGAQQYVYEVQKGDSLERIARTLYGDGKTWKEILAANPELSDEHTIRAGDRLKLPRPPTHASEAVATGPLAETAKPPPAAPATAFHRLSSDDHYRVQKGDTLMSIAAATYGTKAAWRVIYEANSAQIPDKDRIKTGILLKLPAN